MSQELSGCKQDEVLSIKNLSFSYASMPAVKVIDDFSCTVYEGEIDVLQGRTGSGKSTLLSLLKPEIAPHGTCLGTICVEGNVLSELSPEQSAQMIAYVPQNIPSSLVCETPLKELAFGLENYCLPEKEIRRRIFEIVSFFGIESLLHRQLHELSGGQQQLIALASALVMRPKLLLLDEPTSQLDPFAQKNFVRLLERITHELKVAVVVATHDASVFKHAASQYFYLPDEKTLRDEMNFLSSQIADNKRNALNTDIQHEQPVVELSAVTFAYPKSNDLVFRKCFLEVESGELRALVGGNGSGKTTMLKLIAGILKPRRGKVYNNLNTQQGYVPQRAELLFSQQSVQEELYEWKSQSGYSDEAVMSLLEKTGLLTQLPLERLMSSHPYDISGGQQQLLSLVKVLLTEPQLLLLDEPTKGLDEPTKRHVYELLLRAQKRGTTILIATHDMQLVSRLADNVSVLFDGQVAFTEKTQAFFKNSWVWSRNSDSNM